ncbi:site-specific integrase [Vibrio parahaemolyticus]|uniref:tyrosine-type recombinase/integrase n=1 Tax=Vibrio parahaemolyticus TaxID=670 RepID=UPI00111ECD31|nr:site-specific integrase [Vibrio parahaemolyticus]TOG13878.1 site-specific integrase [Vibrio parahaemolyticus]HCG8425517.1 site-specific integrase [Vibrio parahaemolyticus]HCG8430015.1 site-specific integrase [Vibrio parahaemolyticus]
MKIRPQETIREAIDKNVDFRKHTVAPSTLRADKSKAQKLKAYLPNRPVGEFTHSDIHDIVNKLHRRYKNKTINEYLSILRAVFKRAKRDGVIEIDPMEGIDNLSVVNLEPMPFEKSEIKKMYDTSMKCISGKHACLLSILIGARIGEMLAIGWDDIDWHRKVLRIRRAKVLNDYKVPKTPRSVREVELNEIAINLLKQQQAITESKCARSISVLQADNKTWIKEKVRFVFYNIETNRPFLNAKQFSKTFFTPFLQEAGIKHRGVGQLRHTYASQNLTAGISKDWLAQQMGHTNTHMIDRHYGRWMRKDAPDYANAAASHLADVLGHSEFAPIESRDKPAKNQPEILSLLQALIQDKPELKAALLNAGDAS